MKQAARLVKCDRSKKWAPNRQTECSAFTPSKSPACSRSSSWTTSSESMIVWRRSQWTQDARKGASRSRFSNLVNIAQRSVAKMLSDHWPRLRERSFCSAWSMLRETTWTLTRESTSGREHLAHISLKLAMKATKLTLIAQVQALTIIKLLRKPLWHPIRLWVPSRLTKDA